MSDMAQAWKKAAKKWRRREHGLDAHTTHVVNEWVAENRQLRAQVAERDARIAELEKVIADREHVIHRLLAR
jgi:hypothetical protein